MGSSKALRLVDVPGIGEKLAQSLRSSLGGEAAALSALLDARLPEVAAAVGSERRALRLIRAARAALHGYNPDEVAATPDAAEIMQASIETVASYAASKPGKVEILASSPAPSHSVHQVWESRRSITVLSDKLSLGEAERLAETLRSLTWPQRSPTPSRIILVERGHTEEVTRALGPLAGAAKIIPIEDPSDIEEYSFSDIVVYAPSLVEENYPTARRPLLEELLPEAILEEASQNSVIVETLLRAANHAPAAVAEAAKLQGVEAADLLSAAKELMKLINQYRNRMLGEDYGRLSRILRSLEDAVTDLEVWLNDEAKRRLEELELRLTGAELLRLLDAIEAGEARIPDSIAQVFEELSLEAENRLAEKLGLQPEEAALLQGLVEPRPTLPLTVRREPLEALRQALERKASLALLRSLQSLAARMRKLLWVIDTSYRVLLLLDVAAAWRRYTASIGGGVTILEHQGPGVGIIRGRELRLLSSLKGHLQPVSYSIGCTSYQPPGTACENIVLLTGANSGGKTTLLRLIAETALLAQAGLPAPAEKAHVAPFDRVYYISKPTGMLSAGALETLLRRLATIAAEARRHRVLVLVDELEAVTEANAAARIIAAFIESLKAGNAVAVIVTHMAQEVLNLLHGAEGIRVDGIEARGLDENYNLIVDRSPRYNYLARSTPELVVQKLLKKSRGREEKEFYNKILRKMKENDSG